MASQMEVILAVRNQGIENFDKAAEKVDKLNGKFKPFNDSLNKLNQRLSMLAIAYKSIGLLTSSFESYFNKIPDGIALSERDAEARNKQIQSVKNLKDAYEGLKFGAAQGLMSLIGGDEGLNKITAFIEGLTQTRNESYLTNRIAALQASKAGSNKLGMEKADPRLWAVIDKRNQLIDFEIKGLQKELDTMKRRGAFQGIDLKKETPKDKIAYKGMSITGGTKDMDEAWKQEEERLKREREQIEKNEEYKDSVLQRHFDRWEKEQALMKKQMETYAQYAEQIGAAMAAGIGHGAEGLKESGKALLTTVLSIIEKEVLAAQVAAMVEAAILWNPAALLKIAGIAFAFEAAKSAINSFALGTNFAPGGMSLVGERGPELVNLPRGSQVYNNQQTRNMVTNNSPINITVYGEQDIAKKIEKAIRSRELDTRIFR